MTRSAKVRQLLLEGPATRHEMTREIGWTIEQASGTLGQLHKHGHVRILGPVEGIEGFRHTFSNLYELTPHGRAWVRLYPAGLLRTGNGHS